MTESPVVVPIRGEAWVPYGEPVKDLSFALYATLCGGDCAAVERMLTRELDEGEPVPTRQTIARWAREEGWPAKRDVAWRTVGDRSLYDLQVAVLSNFMLAQRIKRDAMTGAYDEHVQAGALALKAAELSDRLLERGIVRLELPTPPEDPIADDRANLTRAEREARANEAMQRRKRDHDRTTG